MSPRSSRSCHQMPPPSSPGSASPSMAATSPRDVTGKVGRRRICRAHYGDSVTQERPLSPGLSFGVAAAAYAVHRPGYARAAVEWALRYAPGPRVLDLGAGTGKLTGALLEQGAEVSSVEPDPGMLVELRRALPTVRASPGSADEIPLPDASVD